MVEAPQGGTNIMTGIGLYANGLNPRAVSLKWMAGPNSLVNDVYFLRYCFCRIMSVLS